MKKIIFFIAISLLICSCQDDTKTHNPGFQGYKDDVLYRGIGISATKDASGKMELTALAQDQELILNTSSSAIGVYYLGTTNQLNKATYTSNFDNNELIYETAIFQGPVSKMAINMTAAGSGYTSDCTLVDGNYNCNSSHETTGGSGSGLKVSVITNTAGGITSLKVASPGNNYLPGDLITVTGGNGLAKCKVLNIEGSNGEIEITEITDTTISGKFKFNARKTNINPFGNELVNFQYGEFYKLPITLLP
jgi:hypothetical protein